MDSIVAEATTACTEVEIHTAAAIASGKGIHAIVTLVIVATVTAVDTTVRIVTALTETTVGVNETTATTIVTTGTTIVTTALATAITGLATVSIETKTTGEVHETIMNVTLATVITVIIVTTVITETVTNELVIGLLLLTARLVIDLCQATPLTRKQLVLMVNMGRMGMSEAQVMNVENLGTSLVKSWRWRRLLPWS